MTFDFDVIVIGGGVGGLAAAAALADAGESVLLVEARNRLGGRVLSVRPAGWNSPAELGAEFVHDGAPPLLRLAAESAARLAEVRDQHWTATNGRLRPLRDPWTRAERVFRHIGGKFGGSFARWLESPAAREVAADDRELATRFAESFHAADLGRLSARALFASAEPEPGAAESDRRWLGGYANLVETLQRALPAVRVQVRLSTPVDLVQWEPGVVRVTSGAAAAAWRARAVVVAVPLGVLQAVPPAPGALQFQPALTDREPTWRVLGWGHAQRLVLRFGPSFWTDGLLPAALREDAGEAFGFVHTAGPAFPVWWGLAPEPLLVGWWAGPAAADVAQWPTERVLHAALQSLGHGVGVAPADLRRQLLDWCWHNWSRDVYARGAYCFPVPGREEATARGGTPVGETIFFAGEAFAPAADLGTVHGALVSGRQTGASVAAALRRRRAARGGPTALRVRPDPR